MNYRFYVGIDVSKSTLDVALIDANHREQIQHIKIENNDNGLNKMFTWMKTLKVDAITDAVFCMEATGLYCYPLLQFLSQNKVAIWIENAVRIKKSMGILRGRNDKVDAMRIAEYALKNIDKLRLWEPQREVVDKLKHLAALRERLVETKKKLLTRLKSFVRWGTKAWPKCLRSLCVNLSGQ